MPWKIVEGCVFVACVYEFGIGFEFVYDRNVCSCVSTVPDDYVDKA